MKKSLFVFLSILAIIVKAQVPQTINYQGVARDASGNPISNQTVGLQFKITTSTDPNFYNETQNGVSTNSLGLFSTKIGSINPLPLSGWENLPSILQVSININNTGFVSLGTQTLASVPYAFYALSSGNSLPLGTRDGQTLRWDSTAQVWKKSNNLTNDDIRIGVGLFPGEIKSKMHVTTFNANDSSAFTAIHFNTTDKQAAIKAFAIGSTNSNSVNPYNTAIFGSQNVSSNGGAGFALGSFNYGSSNGTGVGVAGFGNTKTTGGTAIGVYGTTDPNTLGTNRFAAVFDKGAVLVNDSLMLGLATNPGATGDVLTRTPNGRAIWQTPAAAGFSPFTTSANFIHLQPSVANNKVVIGNTTPALFGYGSKLTVYNPVGSNDTALSVYQNTSAFAIYSANKNPSVTSYAGYFDGGLVSKGKNSLPTSFAFLVKDNSSADLLAVRNDGHIGVGTISPFENVQIQSAASTSLSIISTSVTSSNLFFGDQGNHLKGAIQYDNLLNTMNITVNNASNRVFINNNGNIGLKTNNPGPYDLSVFNPGNNSSIRLNNSLSAGLGLVFSSNNVSSNIISYENTPFNFGNNSVTFMTGLPNGNVGIGTTAPSLNSRLAIKDGHFQSQQAVAPTIGGSNGVTASFWGPGATDVTGIIQLSMGGTTGSGTQATITFNKTYANTPIVILTPVNNTYAADAVAVNHVYVVASPTGFNIVFNTAYANPLFTMYFNYIVIEGN